MSLSNTTLLAIQQAGAAVFAADAELKNSVKDYAARVNTAMATNPFGLGNDALFEHWKRVARLSQTLTGMEEELKKVHALACELTGDDSPANLALPAFSAPPALAESRVAATPDPSPTDVVAKAGPNKSRKPVANKPSKLTPGAAPPSAGGNPAKLLRHLQRLLNARDFVAVNLSAAGLATGIPAGSVNAAVKKLLETGQLQGGPGGRFKLTK